MQDDLPQLSFMYGNTHILSSQREFFWEGVCFLTVLFHTSPNAKKSKIEHAANSYAGRNISLQQANGKEMEANVKQQSKYEANEKQIQSKC